MAVEGGQHRAVAEAVHIVAGLHRDAELLPEISAADFAVPAVGFRRREVAIGLNIPVADDPPAPGLHIFPDALEQRRIGFLNDFVEPRLAAGDDGFRIILQYSATGVRGCQHLADAVLPPPSPYRVQVRIQNQVYDHFHFPWISHSSAAISSPSRTRSNTQKLKMSVSCGRIHFPDRSPAPIKRSFP
ncbi:hypothetical protein SDC9_153007 [bioreactor metagenome]|uniref:Uncharacterized protein n=1 Tax=bioreactor metagenome TaxID=1076179 RepID=A0A645EZD1_9ZZZZ